MITRHFFFLRYISKILFYKFYSIQKNVRVIFASELLNFTDFYNKLLKNLYDCNLCKPTLTHTPTHAHTFTHPHIRMSEKNYVSRCFRVLFQSNMYGEWWTTLCLHLTGCTSTNKPQFVFTKNEKRVTSHSLFISDMNDEWKTIRYFDTIWMTNGILSILYNNYSM